MKAELKILLASVLDIFVDQKDPEWAIDTIQSVFNEKGIILTRGFINEDNNQNECDYAESSVEQEVPSELGNENKQIK